MSPASLGELLSPGCTLLYMGSGAMLETDLGDLEEYAARFDVTLYLQQSASEILKTLGSLNKDIDDQGNIVIYGLERYLERKSLSPAAVVKLWTALLGQAGPIAKHIQFGDSISCSVLSRAMLQRQSYSFEQIYSRDALAALVG